MRAADLKPSDWYVPGDLAVVLRTVYHPQIAATLDRAGDIGRDLATAGPVEPLWLSVEVSSSQSHLCEVGGPTTPYGEYVGNCVSQSSPRRRSRLISSASSCCNSCVSSEEW